MAGYSQKNNNIGRSTTKLRVDKSLHGATRYVQNAVEGAVKTSHDATQNLVNNTMKKDLENFKN